MAEKQAEEKKEEGEGEGGGSKKKLIIIIAIVVLISIGASIGVTLFFLSGDKSAEQAPSEDTPAEPVSKPALYYEFKPAFIVAMNVGGKQRYMQINLAAMGRDQAAFDALETHMPLVRNKLIGLYGQQDFEKLQTKEGKLFIQEESLKIINSILKEETDGLTIERTLFTNFVMQ